MEELIPILIPGSFVIALFIERRFPGRALPPVRGWLLKGIGFFILTGFINAIVPAGVATVVGDHAPINLARLGTVLGGIVGFLVADFVGYWLHRLMHTVPFIWRWSHQMHHSAERMDLAGMSYSHPFDLLATFGLTGLATGLLGLTPAAGALAGLIGFYFALVQHANVRTPQLLGYVMQRPEAHGLHHEQGVHAYNYGSFPLWDILFRTFRNPAAFPAQYGFWPGASSRLGALLAGRDLAEPR